MTTKPDLIITISPAANGYIVRTTDKTMVFEKTSFSDYFGIEKMVREMVVDYFECDTKKPIDNDVENLS